MESQRRHQHRCAQVHNEPFHGEYDFVFVDKLCPGQICSICLFAMRNAVHTQGSYYFDLFNSMTYHGYFYDVSKFSVTSCLAITFENFPCFSIVLDHRQAIRLSNYLSVSYLILALI